MQVAALIGSEGDATPFTDVTVENISHALHGLGYQCRGWEVMYNGHTGGGNCRAWGTGGGACFLLGGKGGG